MSTTINTVSLHRIRAAGVVLEAHEAVAAVQQLIHEHAPQDTRPPFGPPSPENIAVRPDGTVVCTGCDVTPSVAEMAILLQKLLAGVPEPDGDLEYTIRRALHDVDSPPFASIHDFSMALTRHEQGDRRAVMRQLLERLDTAQGAKAHAAPALVDRRSRPAIVTELRRQLREADRVVFEQHAAWPSSRPIAMAPLPRAASPAKRIWSRTVRVPAVAVGLAAALVTLLAAATLHLYRQDAAVPGVAASSLPAAPSLAAPSVPERNIDPQPALAVPPVAPEMRSIPKRPPIHAVTKHAVAGPRRPPATRLKRVVPVSRTPKSHRRRFFGLPLFSG